MTQSVQDGKINLADLNVNKQLHMAKKSLEGQNKFGIYQCHFDKFDKNTD